ncbi:MAG TPA: hypothetical protein VG603_14890 [Chitinophagales bacterium]|nr:hypothetical protein [Chitinophagales bacterium]
MIHRSLMLSAVIFFATAVKAQNFPNAIKQPRQKEMHRQHRKFVKQSIRHHHHMAHANGGRHTSYVVPRKTYAENKKALVSA